MSVGMVQWLNLFLNWVPWLFLLWLGANAFIRSSRRWQSLLVPTILWGLAALALWLIGDPTVVSAAIMAVSFSVATLYQYRFETREKTE